MADKKEVRSLENVKASASTEKRRRLGSAVDKSALALRNSSKTSESIDQEDEAEVPTEDKRVVGTRKERLCLGLILGILLFLILALLAGILVASFLLDQKIESLAEDLKIQIGIVKKCVSPNIAFKAAIKEETWTNEDKDSKFDDHDRRSKFVLGDKVKFDHQLLDTSNSYDTTTGEFTCPVSGLYQISVHIGVFNDLAMFALKRDGETISTVLADKRNAVDWGSATPSVTVLLTKGNKVRVECITWHVTPSWLVERHEKNHEMTNLNTFSGYLIRSSDCDF